MRMAAHYLGAFAVLALYGGRVCPFLDTLTPLQLAAPLAVALAIQAAARRVLVARLVEAAPDSAKVGRTFALELGLFLASGLSVAVFNLLHHGFPPESGLKVVFGFLTVGFSRRWTWRWSVNTAWGGRFCKAAVPSR